MKGKSKTTSENGWLYSAEAVARVQLFFGLECVQLEGNSLRGEHGEKDQLCSTNGLIRHRNGVDKAAEEQSGSYDALPPQQSGTPSSSSSVPVPRLGKLGDPNASLEDRVNYRVHNRFWFYLFAFGASLGDDIFYFTFYPFWFFNLSPWVIRRVILMWGLLMYVGQSSKEILKLPRPSAPPVAPLEKRYFQEYGMPSTHAMVGTLIPFTILIVTWDKIEYPPLAGIIIASLYTLLVCTSRLYKGMHYLLDIFAGIALTAVLMFIAFQFLEPLDTFLITHPYAPIISIATAVCLGLIYPTQNGRSSTRGDTIVIMACTTSIYAYIWLAHRLGIPPAYDELPPQQIPWPDMKGVVVMMVREVLGVGLMGLVYITFRTIILGFLSLISGRTITRDTKRETWVEIPYKYFTYFGVCSASNFLAPFLFEKLGI